MVTVWKCEYGEEMKAAAVLLLLPITTVLIAQVPDDSERRFDEAERAIVRLPPSAFRQLPRNVVGELQRRGCTIPQTPFTKNPHNVIRGEFVKPGEIDRTVLCSVNGISSILVFWKVSEKNPAEIARREDRIFLQGITADEISDSRAIDPVGKDFIMRHYDAYAGPKPPPINH